MDELETALMRWYGIKPYRIESFMDGYVVRSGGTDKYLRKNLFSAGRLLFIHGAKEHLAGKGLNNIDRYILALNGEPYIEFQDAFYTLTERYNGKECDFYDIEDILTAIRTIAQMHLASSGYSAPGGSAGLSDRGPEGKLPPESGDPPLGSTVSMSPVPVVPAACGKESCVMSYGEESFFEFDREPSHVPEPSPTPASPVIGHRSVPCPVSLSPAPEASSALQASDRELSHVLEPSPAPASTAIGNRTVPCPIPLSPVPEASSVSPPDREPSPVLPSPVLWVSRLGKLPGLYERKLRELRKMKNYARKGRTRFDEIYLSVVDRFYDQGRASLNRVRGEAYQRLVEKAYKEKSFNHGNLSHKTIVFGDKGVYIKGFENCGYDIRVTDIVDIIRKRIKKCGWSVDDAASIVSGYDCVAPLSNDEIEVIKGMLQFPYRFWEISNRFYNSKNMGGEMLYAQACRTTESMGQIDRFFERLDNILR